MTDIFISGMTGSQFLTALNRRKVFNALDYGAIGDDATNNTTVLQNIIEDAHENGGTVYIPSGTYKTNTLTTYTNVRIEGDYAGTKLKSIAAESLVKSIYTTWVGKPGNDTGLHNIMLDGDGVGTIGLETQVINGFTMTGVTFLSFTQYGTKLHGSLIGDFYRCIWSGNYIGIYADSYSGIMPNLVTFRSCVISNNSKYGIYWKTGILLKLDDCDLENNGIEDDNTTGAILCDWSALNSADQTLGMVISGCWFESNEGRVINIADVSATCNMASIIADTMFIGNNSSYDILIDGTTSGNKLLLRNSFLKDDNSLLIDGANALVVNVNSFVKFNITQINGGLYSESVSYDGFLAPRQITAALTDDTPTDAEIDAAVGYTPAQVGAGWQCTIKDSSGSSLLYKIESDGSNWFFSKMNIAI